MGYLNEINIEDQELLKEYIVKLEYYCSYQERCLADIKQKMYKLEIPTTYQSYIVEHLQEHNLLNEQRFIETFVNGKAKHKKWGKQKIINELLKKQINYNDIQSAIHNLDKEAYHNRLFHLLNKKKALLKTKNSLEIKQKLYRFALQKGYDSALIHQTINQIINES